MSHNFCRDCSITLIIIIVFIINGFMFGLKIHLLFKFFPECRDRTDFFTISIILY